MAHRADTCVNQRDTGVSKMCALVDRADAPEAGAPQAGATTTAEAEAEAPAPIPVAAAGADARVTGATDANRRARRVNSSTAGSEQRRPADGRSDAELVAELHYMHGPLAVRKVQRLLGVGWPRAKRLADMAGWTHPTRPTANLQQVNGQSGAANTEETETEPPDHIEARTTPSSDSLESTAQCQPDVHLTPFTRYTHLCITIRWGTFVLTNGRCAGVGGDRGC